MLFRRFVILIFGLFLLTGIVSAQNDSIGTTDTVSLFVENLGEGQWLVSVHVWNDAFLRSFFGDLVACLGADLVF